MVAGHMVSLHQWTNGPARSQIWKWNRMVKQTFCNTINRRMWMRKLNYQCLGNHHLDHLISTDAFSDAYEGVQISHSTRVSAATSKETQDVSSSIMPVTSPPASS